MNFFSHDIQNSKKTASQSPISQDILDAVSVMTSSAPDEAVERSPSQAATKGASPFLEGSIPSEEEGKPLSVMDHSLAFPAGDLPEISTTPLKQHQFQKIFSGALAGLSRKNSLFIAGGALLLVLIIGLSVWFFFFRDDKESDVVIELPHDSQDVVTTPSVALSVVDLPYAIDAPNYLLIDTETMTPGSFAALIAQTGEKIIAAGMTKPVEFLLTDKNNNPIAFSRFAYLMQLELSEDLIDSLGESFSIFLFNAGGAVRLGMSLTFSDQPKGEKLITQQEKSLPFLFRPLLFSDSTVPRTVSFRSGAYNAEAVRFVNIDVAQDISFDFVLYDDEWLIGTSKDTLRAILDKKQK